MKKAFLFLLSSIFLAHFTAMPFSVKPKVAVVHIWDTIDFKKARLNLIEIARRNDIQGVVLVVDNQGGYASDFSVLYDLIKKIKVKKPVVSLVLSQAQSAGYCLVSATDYILAHTLSIIGSIGTYTTIDRYQKPKYHSNTIEADMDVELIKCGEYKALTNPYASELSKKQRDYIKKNLELNYHHFLTLVSQNRNLDMKNYKEWAEGKWFEGCQALEIGLIDEIGTIFEAEQKLLELIQQRNPDVALSTEIEYCSYDTEPEKS